MKNILKFALASFITSLSLFLISCSDSDGRTVDTFKLNQPKTEQQIELSLVSKTNTFATNYASNSLGFFTFEQSGELSGHFEFLDAQSKQRVFLSNQLTVTFDETNPGWIDNVVGQLFPMATEEYIFLLHNGDPFQPTPISPAMIRMDLDGRNRKEIFPDGLINTGTGTLSDGEELYYLGTKLTAGGLLDGISLYKTDFENSSYSEICVITTDDSNVFLQAVKDDKVFLQVNTQTETAIVAEFFYYDISENELKSTNFSFVVTEVHPDNNMIVTSFYKLFEENIVYMQSPEYDFILRNLITGEEKIIKNFKDKIIDQSMWPDFSQDIYDGKLMVAFESGFNVNDAFIFDFETEQVSDFTMFRESPFMPADQGQEPIRILGASNDYYLVFSGVDTFIREFMNEEHEIRDYVEGLILKEDYWNNNPNFIDIEDTTLSVS